MFLSIFFSRPVSHILNVTSSNGFHLRPVAKFVSVAKKYKCDITASFNHKQADCKSVNKLLGLSLEKGDQFIVTCKGKDAKDALNELKSTFMTLMADDKEVKVLEKQSSSYESKTIIDGQIIASGIAIAPIYYYKEMEVQKESNLSFKEAFQESINELDILYNKNHQNSTADIYLAQKELLSSLESNTNTLEALEQNIQKASKQLLNTKHESKISDYKDILQRVKNHLGITKEVVFPNESFILVANDLLPSQIEMLSQTAVCAVILQKTSINSHTAILLRGLGITSLIVKHVTLEEKSHVILDAHAGVVVSNPSSNDIQKATTHLNKDKEELNCAREKRFELATTKNGKNIKVLANVTDENSAKQAKEDGADGIGLLRTEFLFKKERPSFEMQVETYEKIFTNFTEITVRTLDVGGDKALPYIELPKENNPFLGIRGIRLIKTHPKIIEEQLHAIFVASRGTNIKIMFPMVSSVKEFNEAKVFAKNIAQKHKIDISNILFGIMIEVPSVLFLLSEFNEVVDFYSIGTNDLTQYLFAIERTHPTLTTDEHSPAVFSAIETIIKGSNKPVSICGELAGNEKAIPKLIEIGVETLSVSEKNIAQTKETIRSN